MNRLVQAFVCLPILAACTTFAQAQDVLDELYGSGVHAFFSGNMLLATERFSEAIKAGSQDPRVYFFRGLTQIDSMGGSMASGTSDFEKGAQLEVLQGKRAIDVAKALQRIQGPVRMEIERLRTQARLASKSKQFELMRQKYEAAAAVGVMPATPAAPGKPAGPNPTDPFTGDGALANGTPKAMPDNDAAVTAEPDAAPVEDPFADDAPAATEAPADAPAAADDPFGAPAAEGAAEEDPFGF